MENVTKFYNEFVINLSKEINVNLRNRLLQISFMEALEDKWKPVRENIKEYINHLSQGKDNIKKLIFINGHLNMDDVTALTLDLLWQNLCGEMNVLKTIHFYSYYKIQNNLENLLTYPSNNAII